jgi:preprotein translocase subunit SecF
MWWDKPKTDWTAQKDKEPLPFMKWRWFGFLVSTIVIIGTAASLYLQGLNMGLDFTGGVQITATRAQRFDDQTVREQVKAAGFEEYLVSTANGGTTVIIRLPIIEDASQLDQVTDKVKQSLGPGVTIGESTAVGAKVSGELFQGGVIASVLALVAIALYIWFRFERKFGMAALITTFHDVFAIVGLFSITRLPFDLTIVAGVLTLAGYSINDKVVVFDRIREMLKKYKKIPLPRIIDISITATLSRTLITSLATMMAGGAMLFLGGPVLFGFAVSICFGIIIGTYSSIFVAAPLLIHLPGRVPGQRWAGEEAEARAAA